MRKTTKLLGAIFGILWALPVWGACYDYTSATGTVVQDGTPTPDNPIEPVFYQQGNMILRAVGDYKDTFDATTGKITRNVGVKVFDGTEDWIVYSGISGLYYSEDAITNNKLNVPSLDIASTHFAATDSPTMENNGTLRFQQVTGTYLVTTHRLYLRNTAAANVTAFKQWLAEQYAAGTPVTIYYPLAEETTEDWTESQYCNANEPIKIATTKYNETAFSPLNTALQNAISVVDTVVSNTITQAGRIATLQAQKQTRPNDIADDSEKCPAGKKCLLVEDASGIPHWYEIVETLLPAGYIQLQWIESTGTQYIDTGVVFDTLDTKVEIGADSISNAKNLFGFNAATQDKNWYTIYDVDFSPYFGASAKPGGELGSGTRGVKRDIIVSTNSEKQLIISLDGVVKTNTTFTGTFITANQPSFAIFTTNGAIMDRRITSSRVWYTKLYKDNILVFNGIPAKNASGVVGMYDLVRGQFYENAGTGEFIAGDPVSE